MRDKLQPMEESLHDGLRGHKRLWSWWAGITALLCCMAFLFFTAHSHAPPGPPASREDVASLFTYPGEKIAWKACGDSRGTPMECSSIDVPLDQFNSTNSGDKTFNIPLIRLRGANATKNLLINPGGPGGSGLGFLHDKGQELHTLVGEGYHLLSFDPRGVNSSTPRAVCYPDGPARQRLSQVRDQDLYRDSHHMYAWSTNFAKACRDEAGEHGKYINTPQTAADMNSILDAVGQPRMAYWGFSYGTVLGQTYASLFPDRAERIIIDGAVNNFDWYGSFIDDRDAVDADAVLDGFFLECAKAKDNCTLSELSAATTASKAAREIKANVLDYLEGLKQDPVSVYVNSSVHGLVTYTDLIQGGIFPSLYQPMGKWYQLSKVLSQALKGNATEAFLAYVQPQWERQLEDAESGAFVTFNDGLSGADPSSPKGLQELLDAAQASMNASLFGTVLMKPWFEKQQWQIPKTHNFTQQRGIRTRHPMLILSTTYDPICPLVSARSAREAFVDSRLVEIKTYGHCSLAATSACVAATVRAYLYEGKVPEEEETQCEAESPFFIKPEDASAKVAAGRLSQSEDERIQAAQMSLAMEYKLGR